MSRTAPPGGRPTDPPATLPDLVARDFTAERRGQKFDGDIT